MFPTDAEPIEPLDFNPTVKSIFKVFDKNTDRLKSVLGQPPDIDEIVSEFQNEESPMYKSVYESLSKSLSKAIKIMELAAEERRFVLTPLIARYSEKSHYEHQLCKLISSEKNIDHVFVKPIAGVESFYYHYNLYIPIPEDILEIEDRKKQVKEHWNIVNENIPRIFREDLIKEFEPLYTIGRVYGWEGAWLAYSVTIIDKGNCWSLPLVKSPFNGAQPFIGLQNGEFAILENDETENSKMKADIALKSIKERIKKNQNIQFEEGKSIEVAPEWIIATNISTNPIEPNLKKASQHVGKKLGAASIESNFPKSAAKIVEFMKKDVMGKPAYEFTPEDIGKCRIHKKL